jgi:hypothetical protein
MLIFSLTPVLTNFTSLFFVLSNSFALFLILFLPKTTRVVCSYSFKTFAFYCLLHLCRFLCQYEIAHAHAIYDICYRTAHIQHTDDFNAHSFRQNTAPQVRKYQCLPTTTTLLHLFLHYRSN